MARKKLENIAHTNVAWKGLVRNSLKSCPRCGRDTVAVIDAMGYMDLRR